jgi:peptidoglycan/LPS O-acetylase OafA/YrhL
MLTLGVIAAGAWTSGVWKPGDLIEMAQNSRRSLLHMGLAGLMILLSATLIGSNWRWPGRRAIQVTLLAALVVVVGLQIWIGTLLMFDTNQGPAFTLNHDESAPATSRVGLSDSGK